jgi:hypothetical protein
MLKANSYVICAQDHVRLRTKARTCAELILMSKEATLPSKCIAKVSVGHCLRQEYITNEGVHYFFSPYKDDIRYRCPSFSGKFSVDTGLTMINITECDLTTSEILIKRKLMDGPVITLTDEHQLFGTLTDLNKIVSELEPIRDVSLANDSVLLKKLLLARDKEKCSIGRSSSRLG